MLYPTKFPLARNTEMRKKFLTSGLIFDTKIAKIKAQKKGCEGAVEKQVSPLSPSKKS